MLWPSEEESVEKIAHLLALLQPSHAPAEVASIRECDTKIAELSKDVHAIADEREQQLISTREMLSRLSTQCKEDVATFDSNAWENRWFRFVMQYWLRNATDAIKALCTDEITSTPKAIASHFSDPSSVFVLRVYPLLLHPFTASQNCMSLPGALATESPNN